MLFYILLLIVLIIPCLFYKYSEYDKMFSAIMSFIMGSIVGAFIIGMVASFPNTKWTEIKRDNYSSLIFSLKTEKNISGSFFLGSGGFGTDEKYYYFLKDERGGFYRGSLLTRSCIIFEKDSVPPRIEWQIVTYKCPSWVVPWSITQKQNTKFDLIVPVGTVIQKFEVK